MSFFLFLFSLSRLTPRVLTASPWPPPSPPPRHARPITAHPLGCLLPYRYRYYFNRTQARGRRVYPLLVPCRDAQDLS
ncbi:hypothetical protein EDB89DRAFT_1976019 [Lactarius sanguifluus]|nr:hypothetical protein EDB89DRAFT_2028158 [Lactarius sanguifluus]KAH9170810.1 hypothetical protein EDB89DRAFT_1976019 [Lactarius sanguifluus]